MKPTQIPINFAGMLSQFLHGWKKDAEFYELQHKHVSKDGGECWWPPRKVASITELMRQLRSLPPADNYLTAQRYPVGSTGHDAAIIDRIWIDIDSHGRDGLETIHDLAIYRKIQDDLRDQSGHSPMVIVFSGRGFHLWIYLAKPVSVDGATKIRDGICTKYGLSPDARVPISNYRMMRLPYTYNSSGELWSAWCTARMSFEDVATFANGRAGKECRWDQVYRGDPRDFPATAEGTIRPDGLYAGVASSGRVVTERERITGGDPLVELLTRKARTMASQGASVNQIAQVLRRTSSEVVMFLGGLGRERS